MRARNIKPGFYINEELAECSFAARLLCPGLWMIADREGFLEDRPKRIKGELFRYDAIDVEPLLQELHLHNHIKRYEIDGVKYIQILAFKTHQSPHYSEKGSIIPEPFPEYSGNIDSSSKEIPRTLRRTPQPPPPDSLNPDSLNPDCSSKEEYTPPKKDYSVELEDFWKAYPKNGASKSETYKSWKKAIVLASPEIIMASVTPYCEYIKSKGIDVAHATTWLNQKRWEVAYSELMHVTLGPLSFEEKSRHKTDLAIEEARKKYANPS